MAYSDVADKRACQARFYARNKERVLEKNRIYREANRCRIRARQTKYRADNSDKIKAGQAAWRATGAAKAYAKTYQNAYYAKPDKRMRLLVLCAFKRAKRRGLPFDDDLLPTLEAAPPMDCACCGKQLDYRMGRGRNERADSPSLDRFDNNGGYTVSNIRVICMRCNEVKGTATTTEIQVVLAYMNNAVGNHRGVGNVANHGERRPGNIRRAPLRESSI